MSYFVRANFVVNLLDSNLSSPDIPTNRAQVFHPGQGQLSEIAMLDARTEVILKLELMLVGQSSYVPDKRHWNVSLNSVHSGPRWNEGQNSEKNNFPTGVEEEGEKSLLTLPQDQSGRQEDKTCTDQSSTTRTIQCL